MNYRSIATVIGIVSALFLNSNLLSDAVASDENFGWKGADGKIQPDTENRKSKNNFAAMLLATDEESLKQWQQLPTNAAPKLKTVTKAKRNVPVVLAVIFVNPKVDAEGNVLISGDISITKPDGKITKLPKVELSKGKLMGSPYNLRLGQPAGYIVENSDPKGKYVINAIVRDNNRNVELSLRTFFTID